MTREEAIKWLIYPTITTTGEAKGIQKKQLDAYHMAIEVLSAEQNCDNCKEYGSYKCTKCDGEMYYKTEPSVWGEWIDRESCQVDEDAYDVAICSNCKAEITLEYPHDHYCPNCGTRMASK